MQATSQSCQPAVAVELFCGVGGFSFGIEQVGFDVGLALQKDETTCQSYPKDFPHLSALRADIVKLTGERIRTLVLVAEHCQMRSRLVKSQNYQARKCRALFTCTSSGKSSYGSY